MLQSFLNQREVALQAIDTFSARRSQYKVGRPDKIDEFPMQTLTMDFLIYSFLIGQLFFAACNRLHADSHVMARILLVSYLCVMVFIAAAN